MKRIILSAMLGAIALTASAETKNDTIMVTTDPIMHCEGCENKIKKNIRFVKGTKKIETSVPEQKVTIIYDKKKSGYADFEKAFRKIGYEIKSVK